MTGDLHPRSPTIARPIIVGPITTGPALNVRARVWGAVPPRFTLERESIEHGEGG